MLGFKRQEKDLPKRRQLDRQVMVEVEDAATFRRGRTLTGSVSSLIRTANEAQADLKSSRVQSHELHRLRRRIFSAFIAVVGVTVLIYMLISQFTAQAIVRVSPDPSIEVGPEYAAAIEDYLTNQIGQRLRPFTDTDRLTKHVQSITPEVASIAQRGSSGFGKTVFEITFREPIASWDIGTQRLYVDKNGVPFKKNHFAPPRLRITDQSGMSTTVPGQSIMSNRFMSYIGQVIGLASKNGYVITTITIPEGMTRQLEVRLDGVGYPFKFSSDRPASEGVEDMVRTISWMNSRQLTPEYADVRVRGRVFYK